jgi:hypothetical protein
VLPFGIQLAGILPAEDRHDPVRAGLPTIEATFS